MLKLSICDVIVSLKSSNGDGKQHFLGRDYIFDLLSLPKNTRGEDILVNVCVRYEGTKY